MRVELSDPVALRMPVDVLSTLDAVAAILDRKRSWVIVRALKAYLAGEGKQLLELSAAHSEGGDPVDAQSLIDELSADLTLIGRARP